MPKRPRTVLTDEADTDDLPAYKVRRIYDHVDEQLKRIRRKSEQDDRGEHQHNFSPHSKNIAEYFKGHEKGKTSVVESFHDILEHIFNVKTKTMEQHANFFIQRECEVLDNDSNISDTEGQYSQGLGIKQEPRSPTKKSVNVFGKGSSMYNPIVIFDGQAVDLEGDGVEVTDTPDENVEIIDLDDSVDNLTFNDLQGKDSKDRQMDRIKEKAEVVHTNPHKTESYKLVGTKERNGTPNFVLSQSSFSPKQPILSVTVTGKTRQVKTTLPLVTVDTLEDSSKKLGRPTSLQGKRDMSVNKVPKHQSSLDRISINPKSDENSDSQSKQNAPSKSSRVSEGTELKRGITKGNFNKSRQKYLKSTTKDLNVHKNEIAQRFIPYETRMKDVTNISLQPKLTPTQLAASEKNVTHFEKPTTKSKGIDSNKSIDYKCTRETNGKKIKQRDRVIDKMEEKREDNISHSSNYSNERSRSRAKHRKRNKRNQKSRDNENFVHGHNAFIDDRTRSLQQQKHIFRDPYMYRNTRPVMSNAWHRHRRDQPRSVPHWKDRFYTRHQIEISWYPIKCDVCHAHFRSRYEFLQHVSKFAHCPFDDFSSGKVALYVCSYCPFETKFVFKIMQHYCSHHGSYFRYHGYQLVMMQALCRF